jgi:hypothetical protein
MLFAAVIASGEVLVVTRSGNTWAVERGESVQINGKDKVRLVSAAANGTTSYDGKTLGHLAAVNMDQYSVLRRTADGQLLARSGAVTEWQTVLPDGAKPKTAVPAAQLWSEATFVVRADKHDKAGHAIRSADLYAIIPSRDAAISAVSVASDLALHRIPGVSDGEAFRAMAALIAPVAKTFPGEPAADLAASVRAMMETRLAQWESGDAESEVLDQAGLLASASEQSFPADAALNDLRKQTAEAKRRLDRQIAILRALDAGGQSDAYLIAYRDFEPFDRSFLELAQIRRKHIEASALDHMDRAKRMRASGDYVGAVRNLRIATLRNPGLAEASKLLEEVRLEVARITSQHLAEARRDIDPRSPSQVQVQRRLSLAEQYLANKKLDEADAAIKEADGIDENEPRIRLVQARVAVARGELGLALALLDLHAGMAITTQDFAEGEKLRAEVLYNIQTAREAAKTELAGLAASQRFATALEKATSDLLLDNEEPAFLYHSGVNACVLRHCDGAAPFLRRYLDLTDSTVGSRRERMLATRLLYRAQAQKDAQPAYAPAGKGGSWFSGAPLQAASYYDPVSLAFQPKVARIAASDHLAIAYDWSGNTLHSVHAKYEDKKTAKNIASLAAGLSVTSSVTWRTAARETNDFYFNYYDDVPQVLSVNHENASVQSRKTRIMVPSAAMMFGGMGVGALGSLGSMGAMAQMGRMGAMSGYGSMRGLGVLASAATSYSSGGQFASLAQSASQIAKGFTTSSLSIHADPAGGSESGYLTLWNSPRIDTELARMAAGKTVAVAFSGNKYFHPFAWDGIHLFDVEYDASGRIWRARESYDPHAPKLEFEWSGMRLMSVTGRHPETGAIAYRRTLSYNGDRLVSERITGGEKQSKIEYKYDKQGRLVEAVCDNDSTLDGRSRKVEFIAESGEKGGR